jgi:hypothetical protein
MTIQIEIDDVATPALRELINQTIPNARQEMVNQIAADVLNQTAQENPVSSGRSRAGWTAAAQRLPGATTTVSSTDGEGTLVSNHERNTSSVTATNHVPYIAFLEYGTSKMAPFSMLRQALAGVIGRLNNMFRFNK